MNTNEVANKLVEWCRKGEYDRCQNELYAENIESHEPASIGVPVMKGLEAVKQKTKQWTESVQEVHAVKISEPVVMGNHFTITMENDVTFKERGRMEIQETCVYEVSNGKIVREQFFF